MPTRPIRHQVAVWCTGAMLILGAAPAQADDFTFRRVGIPGAGTTDRITVQIGQDTPEPVTSQTTRSAVLHEHDTPERASNASAVTPKNNEWFWAVVSPLVADSRPERFHQALSVLAAAPEGAVSAPRLQALQGIAQAYGPAILQETMGTRVSPALALAVIAVESAGRSDAVSSAGAAGLMQLMPATAARFGVSDRLHPAESIRGGVAYLDWLMKRFGGDPILALAAYNAGEGAVDDNGGVPPYAETRAYVPKVLAAWTVARALCENPPELPSDSCVFIIEAL